MILLDTHALFWWVNGTKALGRRAAAAIAGAERLGVPAIVFWELSLLAKRGKIQLGMPVGTWATRVLAIPRLEPIALTAEIALLADSLEMHPAPADRLLVATAMHLHRALVTKDRLLRRLTVIETVW